MNANALNGDFLTFFSVDRSFKDRLYFFGDCVYYMEYKLDAFTTEMRNFCEDNDLENGYLYAEFRELI